MKTGPANKSIETIAADQSVEMTLAKKEKKEKEQVEKDGAGAAGKEIRETSAAILAKLLIRLPEKEKTGEEAEGKTEEKAGENAMGKSDTMVFSIL